LGCTEQAIQLMMGIAKESPFLPGFNLRLRKEARQPSLTSMID
jgi:hypothetical protein